MLALNTTSQRFNPEHFGTPRALRGSAGSGVSGILMIACSDHGTAPDAVSLGRYDDFFIVQQAAAAIPGSDDPGRASHISGIEYAVECLGVRDVIVSHHLGCRIIPYWLEAAGQSFPSESQRRFERDVRHVVDEACPRLSGAGRTEIMIREHLLRQLDNLQSHEFVAARLRDRSLRLHGWLVDDETARVRSFDPASGRFVRLGRVA
jgi:carbonic anhydrase